MLCMINRFNFQSKEYHFLNPMHIVFALHDIVTANTRHIRPVAVELTTHAGVISAPIFFSCTLYIHF